MVAKEYEKVKAFNGKDLAIEVNKAPNDIRPTLHVLKKSPIMDSKSVVPAVKALLAQTQSRRLLELLTKNANLVLPSAPK